MIKQAIKVFVYAKTAIYIGKKIAGVYRTTNKVINTRKSVKGWGKSVKGWFVRKKNNCKGYL